MYVPDQMLRNLAPRELTAGQQREADEQLGQISASVTRYVHRVAARVHAVAAPTGRDGHPPSAFRKAGPARRRAPYRA
jgi:hypothetical protein